MWVRLGRVLEILSLPLALLVILAIGVFVFQSGQAYRRARVLEKQTETTIEDIDGLVQALVDAETGQRGYLLTGREQYLDPYNRGVENIRATLVHLKSDNLQEPNRQLADQVETLARAKMAELAQTVELRRQGDAAGALRIVNEDRGKAMMDDIRARAAQVIKSVTERSDSFEQEADESAARLRVVSLSGAILLFGLLSVALFVIHSATRQRVALIRDLRETEKQVTRARDRFQITLASIGDAVLVTDPEGRVTFINPVAQHLTGWNEQSAVGVPLSRVFRIVHEETRQTVENPVEKVLRMGAIVGLANHTVLLSIDSREIPIDDTAAPIRDADGSMLGVVLVFRDVSERRAAERAVQKGRVDLERSNAVLTQVNADLELFAYAASHDLQEPLRSIASFTELMARRPTTDHRTLEYIRYIQSGVMKLETLIGDLLSYSRLSPGDGFDDGVDLQVVLGEALFNLQAAIRESDATVHADTLPTLAGRRAQLVQLFQNIIGNAIKYRGPEPPRIQVGVQPTEEKNGWIFSIRDNGIGFDMRYANTVFGVFKRLHSDREYPGTGIGLATCKRIIEIHGGAIWVESQVGEGSTFFFKLPSRASGGNSLHPVPS